LAVEQLGIAAIARHAVTGEISDVASKRRGTEAHPAMTDHTGLDDDPPLIASEACAQRRVPAAPEPPRSPSSRPGRPPYLAGTRGSAPHLRRKLLRAATRRSPTIPTPSRPDPEVAIVSAHDGSTLAATPLPARKHLRSLKKHLKVPAATQGCQTKFFFPTNNLRLLRRRRFYLAIPAPSLFPATPVGYERSHRRS